MARDIVISRFVGVGRYTPGNENCELINAPAEKRVNKLVSLVSTCELLRVEIAFDKRLPGFFRTATLGHGGSALDQHSCKRAKIPSIPERVKRDREYRAFRECFWRDTLARHGGS